MVASKRWVVAYSIDATAGLYDELESLNYTHPRGKFSITLKEKSDLMLEEEHMIAFLILSSHTIVSAHEAADDYLQEWINHLCFVTCGSFRRRRKIFVLDWSDGIKERESLIWTDALNGPYIGFLNAEILKSIEALQAVELTTPQRSALRWFSAGLRAEIEEDQFQYFWFCLEISATSRKNKMKVTDKCQFCSGDLKCSQCDKVSTHRPFAKQDIQNWLREMQVEDDIIACLFKTRNTLLHGEDRDGVESAIREQQPDFVFEQAVNLIGKIAWTSLLRSIDGSVRIQDLYLVGKDDFVRRVVRGQAQVFVGTPISEHDPQIEQIILPKISLVKK
ncbi:methylamine utilization protein MauJ [Methylobacterium planeticum]|uniref:Apea-like HEPN domain-containing protein n=1 Tax=Methylobacterium planeticum TaxID=2615211 RepID=A0A6N6MQH8_9HYPH|nr:methylamine utilization protein MauJ [Methylobacterium planeticum]KAB1071505.1 hypothetical protein F6X51_19515 [Methylobacterium planeticum]